MMKKDRSDFLNWYEQQTGVVDFRKELIQYCRSDVDILRRGCLAFRQEFLNIADVDPFQYVTIASVCMAIYRSKFLKENTIASEETHDIASEKSICWLEEVMEKEKITIQHAYNGGEKVDRKSVV